MLATAQKFITSINRDKYLSFNIKTVIDSYIRSLLNVKYKFSG